MCGLHSGQRLGLGDTGEIQGLHGGQDLGLAAGCRVRGRGRPYPYPNRYPYPYPCLHGGPRLGLAQLVLEERFGRTARRHPLGWG